MCPHVIYPPVLFVDNETRVALISVTRGQMGADCDMFHPLHVTRYYQASCGHYHYPAPIYSSSAPHSLMALKYLYSHYTVASLCVFFFWFSVSNLRLVVGVSLKLSFWRCILKLDPFSLGLYLNVNTEDLVENRGEKILRIFPLVQIFAGYLPLSLWRNSTNTNLILQTFIWYFLINARI